jgi:RNA polymerase sigma-70 factor (ECF subfamily)
MLGKQPFELVFSRDFSDFIIAHKHRTMTINAQDISVGAGRDSRFQNTLWSRVIAAGATGPEAGQAAEQLCLAYWSPIYAFLRRSGHDRQQACDFTQGFFAYLFAKELLLKANPDKGRFRSFLLGSLKNFIRNEQARSQALKRGGGTELFSVDQATAEGLYTHEPATHLTPDKLFDRRWAMSVLGEAVNRLEAEYARASQQAEFGELFPYLTGDQDGTYQELAESLGKSPGAARTLVCRCRSRFRQLLRAVIADTVLDVDQVEEELQELMLALRGI